MYGYGLWFYVDRQGQVVCYQKEGYNAGVSGMIRHFPAHDLNVVILSNTGDGAWEPIWKIHDLVVGGSFLSRGTKCCASTVFYLGISSAPSRPSSTV